MGKGVGGEVFEGWYLIGVCWHRSKLSKIIFVVNPI